MRTLAAQDVEGFVRGCVEEGSARGFTLEAFQVALAKIAKEGRAKRLVVVHSDAALARVLAREIAEATEDEVSSGNFEQMRELLTQDCCALVSSAQAARAAQELKGSPYRIIGLKSMEEILAGRPQPGGTALIGVVSRSETILGWAGTLLSALGFSPAAVLRRNPERRGWRRGLTACDIVASDVEAMDELPAGVKTSVLRIVSDEFLGEMRELAGG
jgi:hypothetical protein